MSEGCDDCHERADASSPEEDVAAPHVHFTAEARRQAQTRLTASGHGALRLVVDKQHRHELFADALRPGDTSLSLDGFELLVDRKSRARADGIHVDYVHADGVEGFVIEDPEAPPRVCSLAVETLSGWLAGGKSVWLFDVRLEPAPDAHEVYAQAQPLDDAGRSLLESLSRDVPLVFLAQHRERAWAAAGHAVGAGFVEVYACAIP